MAIFERDNICINYEIHGDGFPILLFAPGGMRSALSFWESSPWNPIESLKDDFQVVAMDQRNAGHSTAPVHADDGWQTYTSDHVALLDHIGVDKCHALGGCIGGPYSLGLIEAIPDRVCSAVLQQPIGAENNQDLFFEMFDMWANAIKSEHPEATDATWTAFRSNMFEHEFLYNVDRSFVRQLQTPLLVLMGNDAYHPESISREIASIAPNAILKEHWQNPAEDNTVAEVIEFLKEHTPK